MLAAEIVQWEQAHPRWRITGESGESPPLLPHFIVSLWESSQNHPGGVQRETLPKTVGGSSRLWPALTERDVVFFGCGEHVENKPPKVWCGSVGATQTLF